VLTDLSFQYDSTRNPLETAETTPAGEWPLGSRQVARTSARYDDAYRLRQIDLQYASQSPVAFDDVAISPLAPEAAGNRAFPVVETAPNRVRQETFDYDWMGNVTAADDDVHLFDRSTGIVSLTSDHPHRVASLKQGGMKADLTYDAAGNVIRVELTRDKPCAARCPVVYGYQWDELGRLAGGFRSDAFPGGGQPVVAVAISYVYNGEGARVLKILALVPVKDLQEVKYSADIFDTLRLEGTSFDPEVGDYVQDARTERVYLSSPAGALGVALFHAPDAPSGTAGRSRVFLALPDPLGSPAFIIDKETSELVEHATFEAAGVAEADFRPDRWGSFRYQYRHTGHADDSEIGLVNFGSRYYAPMLGRWLSPDPLTVHAMAGDMNPYRFVRGSPLRLVDPIGLQDNDCDVMTPGCGFSETFPSNPDVGVGHAAGVGGGSGTTGSSRRSGAAPTPLPTPPDPGVPIKAFDSPAGALALAIGQSNVQLDLPAGYHVNIGRYQIAAANALTGMFVDTMLDSLTPLRLNRVLEHQLAPSVGALKERLTIEAGETAKGDISKQAGEAAVFVGSVLALKDLDPEYIRPDGHHIFPQMFKEWFRETLKINVDRYIAYIPPEVHEMLHSSAGIPGVARSGGLWNWNWKVWIDSFKGGPPPTAEQAFEHARFLLEAFDVYSLPSRTAPVPRAASGVWLQP
jgi:RHS repeat-associated protein